MHPLIWPWCQFATLDFISANLHPLLFEISQLEPVWQYKWFPSVDPCLALEGKNINFLLKPKIIFNLTPNLVFFFFPGSFLLLCSLRSNSNNSTLIWDLCLGSQWHVCSGGGEDKIRPKNQLQPGSESQRYWAWMVFPRSAKVKVFGFGSVNASADKMTLTRYCPISEELKPCN